MAFLIRLGLITLLFVSLFLIIGYSQFSDSGETFAPRADLTTQTIVNSKGETITLDSEFQDVIKKEANIRSPQVFRRIQDSTLTVEKYTTEATDHIKDSSIVIENGGVLKTEYIKNSNILVQKGGDVQVSGRLKNAEIILNGGTFSLRPENIDERSQIIERE